MMAKLTFLGEIYEAYLIVKGVDSIIGYDENGLELFKFSGITDMSIFILEGNIRYEDDDVVETNYHTTDNGYAKKFTGDLNSLILTGLYFVTNDSTNKPWANHDLLVEVKLSNDGLTIWQYARTITSAGTTNQAIVIKRNGKRSNVDVPFTWTATASNIDGYVDGWVVSEPSLSSELNNSSTLYVATSKAVKLVNDKVDSLNTEVTSLKSSVSSGKALVANAITGKGVSTSTTAEFATMANNIKAIPTGFKKWSGTAVSVNDGRIYTYISGATVQQNTITVTTSFSPSLISCLGTTPDNNYFYEVTFNKGSDRVNTNTIKMSFFNTSNASTYTSNFRGTVINNGNGTYTTYLPALQYGYTFNVIAYE